MGGLARHRHPQTIALGRHRAPVGEDRHRHHHRDGERLEHGERRHVALGRKRPVVDRADRIHDGRVLAVELGGVLQHPRIVQRGLERQVGRRRHAAAPVGDDQREAQRPNLLAQPQQRFRLRAGVGVVEAAEDAGVEPARGGRVGLEVADDEETGPEAQTGQHGDQEHGHRRRDLAEAAP